MESTIQIKRENLYLAYNQADYASKKLLENLFGEIIITKKRLIERINSFDDILMEAGIDKQQFENSCNLLTPDEIAYRKIKLIAEVLNEGWTPDWSNSSEYKYYPWFKHPSASGGFSFGDYVRWTTGTCCGSRLCFKSRELAEFAGTTFIEIYNDFLNLNK